MLKITSSSENMSGTKNEKENQDDYLSEFFEALNVNLLLGTNNNMVKKTRGFIYIDKEKALIILSNIIKDLEKKHEFIKSNDFTKLVMQGKVLKIITNEGGEIESKDVWREVSSQAKRVRESQEKITYLQSIYQEIRDYYTRPQSLLLHKFASKYGRGFFGVHQVIFI